MASVVSPTSREALVTFSLQSGESLDGGVHRLARQQLQGAMSDLDDPALEPAETVHEVRKRCKRLRGLLRLVRPALGAAYRLENAQLRDAARALSGYRDMGALVEAHDRLMNAHGRRRRRADYAPLRRALARRQRQAQEDPRRTEDLARFRERMATALERLPDWPHLPEDFGVVAAGFARTYMRGCRALAAARADPTAARFHEWRKRAKYLRYHLRLLQEMWPGPLAAWYEEAKRLSDLLGDEHDLSVYRRTIMAEPETLGDDELRGRFRVLLEERRAELRDRSLLLGERIYAEKPARAVRRLAAYWTAWRREFPVLPVATSSPEAPADR
jgi:CHAD domain-containing protein